MTQRVYTFSPGPAVLPRPVLERAQREMVELPELGISPLEMSHRSPWFDDVLDRTTANLKALLNIPDNFSILYLQGGARLQFSMVPMNLLRGSGKPADYVVTGSWGSKAVVEARREGDVNVIFNSKSDNYNRLPTKDELKFTPDAAYVHITSNETIQGVQFQEDLDTGKVPLVSDASSDFLYRPLNMERYGLVYACAQKNLGPAGVTLVIIRNDLLERTPEGLHTMLDYREHAATNSLNNTPPVFAVYIVMLVTEWLRNEIGGLDAMHKLNKEKAQLLYDVVDENNQFYIPHAQQDCRSLMNVTFRLPTDELTKAFVEQAAAQGLKELKGHRSVGGIRASIYNAMPREGVEKLRDFMLKFAEQHTSSLA